jgi:hypothetical protein
MEKIKKFCQSCGMPMEMDPDKGGTDATGLRSVKYCSYCYESGTFKGNLTSADEMVTLVNGKLKEMGVGPLKRWFYTLNIPRLERWKN